jgi:hypothetical protein
LREEECVKKESADIIMNILTCVDKKAAQKGRKVGRGRIMGEINFRDEFFTLFLHCFNQPTPMCFQNANFNYVKMKKTN